MRAAEYRPAWQRRFLAPRFWPHWLLLGLYRLLFLFPWPLRRILGHAVAALRYRSGGRRIDIQRTNLQLCFPQMAEAEREALLQANLRSAAWSLLDYGLLWWAGERRLQRVIGIDGGEHVDACLAAGRPVILLTCHNLALDFGALAIGRRWPGVGLVKPLKNPLADWLLTRGRTRFQGILYSRDQGLRPVIRALRDGRLFYYLPDEDLSHVRNSDWCFLPFFGVATATITALPRLARASAAAVLPCSTWHDPQTGRYRVEIGPPLEGYPGDDPVADSARMNHELEAMIRRHPEQYMWSLRLFKTRPDGAPSPYC